MRGQPCAFDQATTVDLAEQRAGDNFGEFQPGFEGGNWAGVACPTLGNGNLGAFTLRVRLGTLDEQLQAAPGPGHVFNIQSDEFGTAQRAREAEEKHRLVAGASETWSAGPAQLADLGRGDGGSSPRRTAMLAPDATERLSDRRMPGVEGMAGDATRTGYGGNATAQGRHRITFTSRCQIGPDYLGCRRHGDEPVPVTPSLVVREVGRISPQGRRGIRGVLVGLGLGERY